MTNITKTCPYCGEEILAIAKKCKHCGEWLNTDKICSACGEEIPANAEICPVCGEHIPNTEQQDKPLISNQVVELPYEKPMAIQQPIVLPRTEQPIVQQTVVPSNNDSYDSYDKGGPRGKSFFEYYFKENFFNLHLDGLTPKRQYWMGILSFVLANFILWGGIIVLTSLSENLSFLFAGYAIYAIATLCTIPPTVRRLRDAGKNGWFILIFFIPLVGSILLLIALVKDGKKNSEYVEKNVIDYMLFALAVVGLISSIAFSGRIMDVMLGPVYEYDSSYSQGENAAIDSSEDVSGDELGLNEMEDEHLSEESIDEKTVVAKASVAEDNSNVSSETSYENANKAPSDNSPENLVYDVVDQMPSFPGGQNALIQYLSSNIKYPVAAEKKGIQGRVKVQFVVEKDGRIVDAAVVEPVEPSLDKEALRVVNSMPKWRPGIKNGENVRVKYYIPIVFRFQ